MMTMMENEQRPSLRDKRKTTNGAEVLDSKGKDSNLKLTRKIVEEGEVHELRRSKSVIDLSGETQTTEINRRKKRNKVRKYWSDRIKPSTNLIEEKPKNNTRNKIDRSDSFIKRFVKTSKENITEGCEKLVRNIRKSPRLLKKKLHFGKSNDSLNSLNNEDNHRYRPVPPVRRKGSRKRPLLCELELLKKPEELLVLNKDRNKHEEDSSRSKSVSIEDVEDLIRSEDNLRLLEERVHLRRRFEKKQESKDSFLVDYSSAVHKRYYKRSKSSREKEKEKEEEEVNICESERCKFESKVKYYQTSGKEDTKEKGEEEEEEKEREVQRSSRRKRQICDNANESFDLEEVSTTVKQLSIVEKSSSSNQLHARASSTSSDVKCKLANLSDARGVEEEGEEEQLRERERDRQRLRQRQQQRIGPRRRINELRRQLREQSGEEKEEKEEEKKETEVEVEEEIKVNGSKLSVEQLSLLLETPRISIGDFKDEKSIILAESSKKARSSIEKEKEEKEEEEEGEEEEESVNSSSPSIDNNTAGDVLRSVTVLRNDSIEKSINDRIESSNNDEKINNSSSSSSSSCIKYKKSSISRKDSKMKLTIRMIRIHDKLVLGLSAFAILFTLLLVMDLQMDLGYSGHHLVPSHGRARIGDDPNVETVYTGFRRKFLQRTNASKEQYDASTYTHSVKDINVSSRTEDSDKHDDFADLIEFVANGYDVNADEGVVRISGEDHSYNPTLGELRHVVLRKNATTLEKFHLQISRTELYPKDSIYVDELLRQMAKQTITHVVQKEGGTQLKLVIDYVNNMQALFKPMR
ncbi:hypothetical protein M0802_001356 [Mischocyttarus mexicanus]|nr:hypothetical protein M0802_001356 [Mischocyttarus mexicanus]